MSESVDQNIVSLATAMEELKTAIETRVKESTKNATQLGSVSKQTKLLQAVLYQIQNVNIWFDQSIDFLRIIHEKYNEFNKLTTAPEEFVDAWEQVAKDMDHEGVIGKLLDNFKNTVTGFDEKAVEQLRTTLKNYKEQYLENEDETENEDMNDINDVLKQILVEDDKGSGIYKILTDVKVVTEVGTKLFDECVSLNEEIQALLEETRLFFATKKQWNEKVQAIQHEVATAKQALEGVGKNEKQVLQFLFNLYEYCIKNKENMPVPFLPSHKPSDFAKAFTELEDIYKTKYKQWQTESFDSVPFCNLNIESFETTSPENFVARLITIFSFARTNPAFMMPATLDIFYIISDLQKKYSEDLKKENLNRYQIRPFDRFPRFGNTNEFFVYDSTHQTKSDFATIYLLRNRAYVYYLLFLAYLKKAQPNKATTVINKYDDWIRTLTRQNLEFAHSTYKQVVNNVNEKLQSAKNMFTTKTWESKSDPKGCESKDIPYWLYQGNVGKKRENFQCNGTHLILKTNPCANEFPWVKANNHPDNWECNINRGEWEPVTQPSMYQRGKEAVKQLPGKMYEAAFGRPTRSDELGLSPKMQEEKSKGYADYVKDGWEYTKNAVKRQFGYGGGQTKTNKTEIEQLRKLLRGGSRKVFRQKGGAGEFIKKDFSPLKYVNIKNNLNDLRAHTEDMPLSRRYTVVVNAYSEHKRHCIDNNYLVQEKGINNQDLCIFFRSFLSHTKATMVSVGVLMSTQTDVTINELTYEQILFLLSTNDKLEGLLGIRDLHENELTMTNVSTTTNE